MGSSPFLPDFYFVFLCEKKDFNFSKLKFNLLKSPNNKNKRKTRIIN